MPYHKIRQALPQICELDAKLLILIGNDLAPAEIEAYIRKHASGIKKILFGFQVSGGKKEPDKFVCERLGGSWMDIGQLHGETDPRLRKYVARFFAGTSSGICAVLTSMLLICSISISHPSIIDKTRNAMYNHHYITEIIIQEGETARAAQNKDHERHDHKRSC